MEKTTKKLIIVIVSLKFGLLLFEILYGNHHLCFTEDSFARKKTNTIIQETKNIVLDKKPRSGTKKWFHFNHFGSQSCYVEM